jgi:hypothetical protein
METARRLLSWIAGLSAVYVLLTAGGCFEGLY